MCQLFVTVLTYVRNTIFIKGKRVCIKLLRIRLKAIQKLKPPKTAKDYMSFAGVVNYFSMLCPNLQKLLKLIYDLTRKGRPFIWTKVHQEAFEEIKVTLLKPPVFPLLHNTGRFQLFSDTSKTAAGSALCHIQMVLPN